MGRRKAEKVQSCLQGCPGYKLRKASRVLTGLLDHALKPTGLRSTQAAILATINAGSAPTIALIARKMEMDPSSLTRALQPLIRAGFVELVHAGSGPAKTARLTPSGRAQLNAALDHWESASAELVERFGAARWNRLREDLAAVVQLTEIQTDELPLAVRARIRAGHRK